MNPPNPPQTPRSTPWREASLTPSPLAAGLYRPFIWLAIVTLLLLAAAVSSYQRYATTVRGTTEALLQSIARSRAESVRAHLNERIADAWLLSRRDRLRRVIERPRSAVDSTSQRELVEALTDLASAYRYHNIMVFGPDSLVLAQLHADSLDQQERQAVWNAIAGGYEQPILLHVSNEGMMEYGVVAPIHLGANPTGPADGALYLVLDVDASLMPMLRAGDVPSASFRTVLLQVGTDSAIAVAAGSDQTTAVTVPRVVPRSAVEQLRRGNDPEDFDRLPVLRGIAQVPSTPWTVAAMIDREEAEAPIRIAGSVVAVTFLLLLALTVTIGRNLSRRNQRRDQEEMERLAQRTLRVVQTATDGFVVLDDEGRFLDVNEALHTITGYTRDELLGKPLSYVQVIDSPDEVPETLARIRRGTDKYVSRWRRRDGRIIDLEVNATYIAEDAGGRIYAFVRDITESLASRRRLERVNRLYAFLNHAGEALFRTRDREEAFAVVCRISVQEGGFPLAWVGVIDEERHMVVPAVVFGEAAEYVQSLGVTLDPELPTSQGPTGRCIREGRSIVMDDFASDPGTRPWQEAAVTHGLRSCAALPVMVDGRPVAALVLYDKSPRAFDAELITLLEEIARILGLVLQGIETERQRTEEQERRRRSEERFRIHFEALPVATYVVHESTGQVRRVNRAFINLFGYESYDVPTLEASFERFFADPVYRAQTFEVFRRDLAEVTAGSKPRRSREYTIRCRDGSERTVQAIVTRAADELIIGWVDLTELRRSQELLRDAQRIARLGSWSYDFRTRVRELSDDTIELFDLDRSRGGMQGMMAAAFSREILGRLEAEFFRALRERRVYEITVPMRNRYGAQRQVFIRSRIEYDERGVPLRAVGSAQDVTEQAEAANELARYRDQLEELVAQRTEALAAANTKLALAVEEADAANRAKSAFLAVMSHEIRTPLNGVIGMAEVLAQSALPARDAEAVRIIRGSATNLLGIIDDILDFSKIEAGRIDLEREETTLGEVLDGVQAALAPMADARGVDVSQYIAPDVPERIVTDATRLRQICYNLLGNAIKFSGGRAELRGRVTLRVDVAQAHPLQLRIAVHDNGIGMSPDTMAHLFTSFTQAEISTTRRFGGTGLGLAICKRLADVFGGSIAVQSELGVGSTFTVIIPTTPAPAPADRLPIDVNGVPCVILRDGDASSEADDIASYLRHSGASVTIVDSLAAAHAALGEQPKPAVFIRRAPNAAGPTIEGFDGDDVRSLHITEGRRRSARIMAPNLVTLDRLHLRARSLLRGVAIAAGRASPELLKEEMQITPMPARRANPISVEQARTTGQLILVAEDDEVNQKVILQQLELLGYAAEIARNGREALDMLSTHRYALLLSDLHMPVMDGYELTRQVRALEQSGAREGHLPILALTANALRGEEVRTRDIGMDAFLTKPVLLNVLKTALARWVAPHVPQPTPAAPVPAVSYSGNEQPILDVSVLESLVGNDADIIMDFLSDYRSNTNRLAGEIRLALAQGDLNTVGAAFHKLKSSSRSVGALCLGELSHKIELAARGRDADSVNRLAQSFEPELEAVMNALSAVLP